ncbi:hypothetical protein J1605_011931 [Eschrichtius robustus]|uniref:Uncharacterized protein n=1 Tax=Eschrichtius robustus TaxID=9764 RepID=A0AB34GKL6_ESCRO|nr:hypothetical protein J1605_011931 [Eschrichtius robustus]
MEAVLREPAEQGGRLCAAGARPWGRLRGGAKCSEGWHGSVQQVYYIIITIYQEARQLEVPSQELFSSPESHLHEVGDEYQLEDPFVLVTPAVPPQTLPSAQLRTPSTHQDQKITTCPPSSAPPTGEQEDPNPPTDPDLVMASNSGLA